MNITEQYYHDNSQEFFDSTINADTTPLYDHFLKYVPDKGYIRKQKQLTRQRSYENMISRR